jgi:hypothetical protein
MTMILLQIYLVSVLHPYFLFFFFSSSFFFFIFIFFFLEFTAVHCGPSSPE